MPPRRAPNLQRNLARTITLADGRQVKSLHDARTVLLDLSGSVNARSGMPDYAIRLLIEGGRNGQACRHCGGDRRDRTCAARPAAALTARRSKGFLRSPTPLPVLPAPRWTTERDRLVRCYAGTPAASRWV